MLREAREQDVPFLWEMLYDSLYVPTGQPPWPRSILEEPEIAHYLAGWGRAGDTALLALQGGRPVGAAWYRQMPAEDPGFGYVAEDVPEVGIALVEDARGHGIGTALLEALTAKARHAGFRALSLSVQPENPARRLYERLGWMRVGRSEDAWTMLRPLSEAPPRNGA